MPGPAATITHMHTCPMWSGSTPHVGGPVIGPGVPTVLIGGKPAAVMGDQCTCSGPPDIIVKGEATILIGGKPAATMGSTTAHGGVITLGDPTVLFGTGGSGATAVMAVKKIPFPEISFVNKLLGKNKEAIANQEQVQQEAAEQPEVTLSNLLWKQEKTEISETKVGEKVMLTASVQGIDEGSFVVVRVYEKDENTEDDFITSVAGKIENGAIEAEWEVVYTEDSDDIESAQELQEKQYTLPEYVFKYDNSNGETVESNLLEVKDVLELRVIDQETGEPLANVNYSIALPNGELLEGTLDTNGYALVEALSASKNYPIVFYTDEDIIATAKY